MTLIRHLGVSFDEATATIGDFVVLGLPPSGMGSGELTTVIGARVVLRSHTVLYAGNVIGDDFQTGHGALIREENRIGHRVSIGSHSVVEHHVSIADDVRIHSNAFVPEFTVLEAGCWIGPCAVLTNARYPLAPDAKASLRGPQVERGAIIGAGAVLLPGIRIGAGALVGAGAVVVEDVAPGAVVAGNPARLVRQVSEIEAYRRDALPGGGRST